jgi:hypothetical protein
MHNDYSKHCGIRNNSENQDEPANTERGQNTEILTIKSVAYIVTTVV